MSIILTLEQATEVERAENELAQQYAQQEGNANAKFLQRLEDLGLDPEFVLQFRDESFQQALAYIVTGQISVQDALAGNASYGLHLGIVLGLEIARRERDLPNKMTVGPPII